jgi:anaerobic selenocysteine-containing dehydrogenase
MSKITRRAFLRLAGIGAAALGAAGYLGRYLRELVPARSPPRAATLRHSTWIPTICRICPAGCGVVARVVEGRVVKVEGNPAHPVSQGKLCPRAQAALQVLYDPDRVQGPLRRVGERGEDRWEPISWDEAIDQVASHLVDMRERGQAHRLLFLHGTPPGHVRELIDRFCRAYGSPNSVADDGWDAERLAHLLTQGWFDLAAHDWERTSYALFFGGSFLEDWQPQLHTLRTYSYVRRARPGQRTRLVQVSPRFSVSAAKADEWVPILPGRSGALALGMAHVIVRERLCDGDFIANHSAGFEDLAALVSSEYTPENVTAVTGVPADTIRRLAREFAGSRPAVAVVGRGLEEGTNALFTHLAVHVLNALVGSIDVPGGVLRPRSPPYAPWPSAPPHVADHPRIDGAGTATLPLAAGALHTLPTHIACGIPYRPEVIFLHESNPFFEAAGASLWRVATQCVPLIVSFSPFKDESTLFADLILPDHTFLERWGDGVPPGGTGVPTVAIGRPAVSPLHDTAHTGDVLLTLARAIGGDVATHFPWTDLEDLLRFRARGLFEAGGSIRADSFDEFWSTLLERGCWFGAPYAFGRWEEALATPSGRFQFRLDQLEDALNERDVTPEDLGLQAAGEALTLPHYEPPHYAGDPQEYPLHLIPYQVIAHAGCRAPNAPLLWEMYGLHLKEMWHNWVEINPETAERLGIHDGEPVWVESPQGRIRLKARLYEGVMADAVNIPVGGGHTAGGRWASRVGGGNVAELVVPQIDRLSGTVAWCGTRVRVTKA